MQNAEGYWETVTQLLQDICNANELLTFDATYEKHTEATLEKLLDAELENLREEVNDHRLNIDLAQKLISIAQENIQLLIVHLEKAQKPVEEPKPVPQPTRQSLNKVSQQGRLFWTLKYDTGKPIVIGLEVAYKLRNRHFEEWIQCEVTKIYADGTKYEIRDPEPDENNNPGQTFKATYKEILLIPFKKEAPNLVPYLYGTKVLARYPETTTFYPAVVVGLKKDGRVRLKFDGEEEVNKETEVERRLVLPFPEK